jgi:hypothetical protein
MRVRVYGLTGCQIRFRFAKDLTETRVLREALAQMQRPVQPGDHDVAVQWRGRANEDDIEIGYNFRSLVTTLAELERDAPDVASVMKKNNVKGFVLCDAFVLSQPQGQPCQVYGIFTVDRKALASGKPNAPVIKQDFLVHDMTSSPPEITYYTGLPTPGPHKSIGEFCERFGAPNYGCELVNGKWRCRDHHYPLEEFARLPGEPAFRKAIEAAIEQARVEAGSN